MPPTNKHRFGPPRSSNLDKGGGPLSRHRGAAPEDNKGARLAQAGAATRSSKSRFLKSAPAAAENAAPRALLAPPKKAPVPKAPLPPPVPRAAPQVASKPTLRSVPPPVVINPSLTPPPKESPVKMLTNVDRDRLFGHFSFKAAPSAGNPERIIVDPAWAREHIITVPATALERVQTGIVGLPPQGVDFHKLVAPHFEALIAAWDAEGLLSFIKTWNGSYVPRFRRGQADKQVLSAHCLPATASVWTTDGPANIADLRGFKGRVLSYSDGLVTKCKVGDFFVTGRKKIVSVRAGRHRLRCSADHPVLVLRKRSLPVEEWIQRPVGRGQKRALYWTEMYRADALRPGDRLVVQAESAPAAAKKSLDPDWAEVLGMFLGDGCVHHRDGTPCYVSFSIPQEDRIRDHATGLLARFFNLSPSESDKTLSYHRDRITSVFSRFDCYAREKSIPPEVFKWPKEMQRRFVLGLLYTDGTTATSQNRSGSTSSVYRWKMGSEKLITGLKQLLTQMGLVPSAISITPPEQKIIKGVTTIAGPLYTLATRDPHGLLSPDADPLYAQRVTLASPHLAPGQSPCYGYSVVGPHFTHVRVQKVETEGVEDVFDIEVPGPHNFVTGGVVVSNSWGSAFDLNARWNVFRQPPAALGAEGSVRALVAIANKLGWMWGGDFSSPDGMHFEAGAELFPSS